MPSRLTLYTTAAMAIVLAACTSFEKQPDRYNTAGGERHPPVLNPGGGQPAENPQASASPEEDPYSYYHAGNGDSPMPAGMMAGTPAPSNAGAPIADRNNIDMSASGRRVPLENQQALNSGSVPVVAAVETPPVDSAPVEVASDDPAQYQPMTTPSGDYPTLADVPEKPADYDQRVGNVKEEAASFAADNQAELPAPATTASTPDPAPTYEAEMHANDPMLADAQSSGMAEPANAPAVAQPEAEAVTSESPAPSIPDEVDVAAPVSTQTATPVEPEAAMPAPESAAISVEAPAPSPMQQYGQSYYGDGNASATQPSASEAPLEVATAPVVSGSVEHGSGETLAPIQLRAPTAMAGARNASLLPPSRYAARRQPDRPGTLRH